ncbi:MAG: MFS transporter, partial [Betaproteobacteria bacterium]
MDTTLPATAPATSVAAPATPITAAIPLTDPEATRFRVLGAISFSHFLNDLIQSLILAIYPLLKGEFNLSFTQIGLITLTYQITASLLQPLVGLYTDKHPKPYSLAVGMGFTLVGLLVLSVAPNFSTVLVAAALVGTGSSIFHPESSRIARMASGGRHGLAQSIFQVGGNTGSAVGPLLAALIIIPHGQPAVAWFGLAALLAIVVLWKIGSWYRRQPQFGVGKKKAGADVHAALPRRIVVRAFLVLMVLIFSKYFYVTSISSYYIFYLMHRFDLSVQSAQVHLFIFLFARAAGTLLGGPIGDRIGRKRVIWVSILGIFPLSVAMPYVGLEATVILSALSGMILASAFPAIIVYAQDLVPSKVGM